MANAQDNPGVLVLYPLRFISANYPVISAPLPPANVPVGGLAHSAFIQVLRRDGSREGATEVQVDPPSGGEYQSIALYMTTLDDPRPLLIERKPVAPDAQDKPTVFNVFQSLFVERVNIFFYVVKRNSGNDEPSRESWALYHHELPGGNDVPGTGAHPYLMLSLPPELGNPPRIGKEEAAKGVPLTVSYPHGQPYDTILLMLNGKRFPFTLQPGEENQPHVILLTRELFEQAGNNPAFEIRYTVISQVNNPTHKRRESRVIVADVDLAHTTLDAPILREDLDDSEDDPGLIDRNKLKGGPLWVVVLPRAPTYQAGDTVQAIYRSTPPDLAFPTQGIVEKDGFGQFKPCLMPVPNDRVISGSQVRVAFELVRNGQVVGRSKEAMAQVGTALNLPAPSVKEAVGNNLNPIAAKDTLTVVVPQGGLQPTDLLSVTWTGTAGAGSHPTTPAPISSIGLEIPIPVSVIAFNLGKPVTVTYTVTRGTSTPQDSLPFTLNVLTLPISALPKPKILQADNDGDGPGLNLTNLTAGATIRLPSWPHIAAGQKVWLSLKGKKANGDAHDRVVFTQPSSAGVGPSWVTTGYYDASAPYSYLKDLGDASTLTVEFKASLNQGQTAGDAVSFPVRTYTVRAVALIAPTIDSAKDSKGVDIPQGGITVDTSVTLTGTASKGLKVEVFDGTVPKGQPTADPTTGIWTLTVSALSVAAHSFTVKALYGSGAVSAARTFTVTSVVAPTISSVKGSPSGVEIPNGTPTVETAVTLTGSASKGQKVDVLDGALSKGQPTADPTTGIWTLLVSGLSVTAHSFTAKALYGAGQTSAPRSFTVIKVMFDEFIKFDNYNLNGWNLLHADIVFEGAEFFAKARPHQSSAINMYKNLNMPAGTYELSFIYKSAVAAKANLRDSESQFYYIDNDLAATNVWKAEKAVFYAPQKLTLVFFIINFATANLMLDNLRIRQLS